MKHFNQFCLYKKMEYDCFATIDEIIGVTQTELPDHVEDLEDNILLYPWSILNFATEDLNFVPGQIL